MKNGIFHKVFRNFWYKIFALLLSIVIWSLIQGEQVLELNREITITIDVPDGYTIRGDTVRVKAATVKGPRVLMLEVPNALEANISLPEGKIGNYRVRLDKDDIIDWNSRLGLTIHDPYLSLFIDEKASKTVPIKQTLQGTPAEGHIIEKVTLKPRLVTITGLKSDLLKVTHLNTESIDITGIHENTSIESALYVHGFTPGNLSVKSVTVHLQVGDSKVNNKFGGIPIQVDGSELATEIRPRYVTIILQGTPSTLSFLTSRDLRAFIDLHGLQPGTYEQDIKVKIPPNTVLIETLPEKVSVKVLAKKLD